MRLGKLFGVASLAIATLSLGACGGDSSTDSPPPGGGGLQGEGEGNASAAPDTNPAGDVYPSTAYGVNVGQTIRNFKFLGYPDADSSELKPISLAQFYDPSGATYKMIHIQAAGVWCSVCRAETRALIPLAKQLKDRKVVWIVSIAEGPKGGEPSTKSDLDGWIREFSSPFTHVLDPANKNLGVFYNRAALPWNANIDASTMKVITSGTGGRTTGDRILEEVDDALSKLGQ